jgi:hypothetical protein
MNMTDEDSSEYLLPHHTCNSQFPFISMRRELVNGMTATVHLTVCESPGMYAEGRFPFFGENVCVCVP